MANNKKGTIKYKNKSYEIVFNLNVMEKIQEEYESIEAWGELTNQDEPNIKALKYGIREMINEGIDIYNEDHEEDPRTPFTDKQIGRLITEVGLANVAQTMNDTVIDSTKSDEKN